MVGAQFNVETGSDNVNEIRVVALPGPAAGDFVVVWDDDSDDRTEMRQFNSDGTTDGSQVTAFSAAGTQVDIGVTVDGRILVAQLDQSNAEVDATIWDSRSAADIDAGDYSSEPNNFLRGTVVTSKKTSTDFDGNASDNAFFGQDGNDTAHGFDGNDTLIGGGGQDELYGGNNDDSIRGGIGNDTLSGGFGDDTIVGDTGSDTVDYSYSAPSGSLSLLNTWRITLGSGFNSGSAERSDVLFGVNETDQLFTVENVIGSGWRDIVDIRGQNNATNLIQTFDGNDEVITSTLTTNNDTLDGGDGTDTLTVEGVYASIVTYDLGAEEARFNDEVSAKIIGFENIEIDGSEAIIGSDVANRITVNNSFSSDNVIDGAGGDDTIQGGNGNDSISGGDGNDLFLDNMDGGDTTIDGGLHTDTLDVSGADAGVIFSNIVSSRDISNTSTLTLQSIQNFVGTAFADDVSESTATELNEISLGGGNDTMRASANGISDAFFGGTGIDLYIESSTIARVLNLEDGEGGGVSDPDRIVLKEFENVIGGSGNDTITGTEADGNLIDGGSGNDSIQTLGGDDTIVASSGSDTYDGGAGVDEVDYSYFSTGVTIDLNSQAQSGPGAAGNDTLIDIENVTGTQGNDIIRGNSSSNYIDGHEGNDTILATGGADTYVGGTGVDTVNYSVFSGAITVDLGLQAQSGGGAASNDTLIDIENVIGTKGNDTLTGNSEANVLDGAGGNDSIDGDDNNDTILASSGADTYNGGAGIDTVDYSGFSGAITVDLGIVSQGGSGAASNDDLIDIENVIGTSGDDLLTGNAGTNVIDGYEGADTIVASNGADTYIGGAGSDTVDYSAYSGAITVDLNVEAQAGGGAAGNDTLIEIENVIGTSGNDTLTGNGEANVFDGSGGNDDIDARGGDDTIVASGGTETYDGGTGVDTVDYSGFTGAITIDLSVAAQGGGGAAGNDVLIDIENVIGTQGNDTLQGDSGSNQLDGAGGNDSLDGDGGNDTLIASSGADTYDGGSGTDTVNYSAFSGGITVDLGVTAQGGSGAAGNDTLIDIENVVGTGGNDQLTGDGGINVLDGYGGDDTIVATGGADTYDGGSGTDMVDYSAFSGAITVDLNIMAQGGGGAAGNDTLIDIEGITGTQGGDSLTGNGNANVFDGAGGNDTIYGQGGNDTIIASGGTETYDGGSGLDTVDYSAFSGAITVDLNVMAQGGGGAAGNDTLIDIENVIGTSGDDTLTGNGDSNFFDGSDGDDILTGAGGADVFHFNSGDGSDQIQDFENNIDSLEFDNFTGMHDVNSFLTAYATESGGDVIFDFGSDGMVTVIGVTIGQIDDDMVLV